MKIWTLFGVAALGFAGTGFGQYATDPVGVVNLSIAPSPNGTARALTVLSSPLLSDATGVTGATVGIIDAVTANTITDNEAGWVGTVSPAATPKILRITSGAAEGRTFLLASTNTGTAVTLDATENSTNLTSLGIVTGANGDSYKIFDCETLSSFFGDPANIVKNNSVGLADQVLILIGGTWNTFFYHTTNNRWSKSAFGTPNATNQPIKPETALLFSRIGTGALSLTVTGPVSVNDRVDPVAGTGISFLGSNWPVDITLLNSQIHAIPGWVSNASAGGADQVLLFTSGAWNTFWYTGTGWKRQTFGNPGADGQLISAGSGVLIKRIGTSSASFLSQAKPF